MILQYAELGLNSLISVGLNYKAVIIQQINSNVQACLQTAAWFQTLFSHRLQCETANRLAQTAKSKKPAVQSACSVSDLKNKWGMNKVRKEHREKCLQERKQ